MQTDVAKEIFEVVKVLPEAEQLAILQQAKTLARADKKPSIWDKIREHAGRISESELANMPADGSEQHDHYLYGTPKK